MPTSSRDDPNAPHHEWSGDELIPFGKYILLNKISSGASAAVYRAKIRGEAGFERLVAVKRILPHMAGDPEFVNTFVREAKTAARLNHTNICPIYELGKVGESLYMAMEWVAGKDLGTITRRIHKANEVLPPVLGAWIAAKLCDALDYAHTLKDARGKPTGIIHRDLSPTNIVLSYEGQVKLIDFGLAKAAGRAQQTNVDALKKKLGYMSPELVKGKAPDSRSDIFGVGVCLYEMVTGRRLFAGKDDMATLKMVSTASVPPPSALVEDAPEDLELIIMRALEREPEDRWQSASEMGQALMGFLATNDPRFGTRQTADWMLARFAKDMESEQQRVNVLLEASHDARLMEERRHYFASPAGAAALAKAELARRMSTQPPPVLSDSGRPLESSEAARNLPKTPPLPRIALDGALRAPAAAAPAAPAKSRAATAAFDDEPTSFLQAGALAAGTPARASAQEAIFEDEPTNFFDADKLGGAEPVLDPEDATAFFDGANHAKKAEAELSKGPARTVAAPGAVLGEPGDELGYESEKTEFLGGEALSSMVLDEAAPEQPKAAAPRDGGGFGDEEATHIFFNKEDGVGVAELLAEEPDAENPARISVSQVRVVNSSSAASAQPSVSPRMSAPIISPQLMAPAQPIPAAHPMSPSASQRNSPTPAQPSSQAGRATMPMLPQPRQRSRTATMQMRVAKRGPDRISTVLLILGVTMLTLAVAGLIINTPMGVTLGLRAPDVGSIEIRTTPVPDAMVKLDGVVRGRAPLRMSGVRVGKRRLELQAAGYAVATRDVELSAGTVAMVDIALVPLAGTQPAAP